MHLVCVNCIWGAGLYAGVYGVLVMHRSIPAAPPPPQLTSRALEFFFLDGKFPGMGALKLPNAPWWGRRKRTMPCPQDCTSPSNTAAVFIHCTIVPLSTFKCVIFCFCRSTSPSSNWLIMQTTLHDS